MRCVACHRRAQWLAALLALATAAAPALTQTRHAGGPPPPPAGNCLPAEEASRIIAASERQFPSTGDAVHALTLYADPVGGGTHSFGQTVTNYVDLAAGGGVLDWNCGTVTYDGHAGNDIEIRSFVAMDEGVPALCAAAGTVTSTRDGEFDRHTQWQPGVSPNYVAVRHADGSYAFYLHLRRGSVRVAPGQPVAAGDTLGMIGSSGFSSGPHLHFETQDPGVVEPYSGGCQGGASRWISQLPYAWALPFEVFDHGATTIPPDWPTILESPPSKSHVTAGSTVYSWARLRNATTSVLLRWNLYKNGALWSWYSFYPGVSYTSSWWYVYWTIPEPGAWRFDLLCNGFVVAQQSFTVDAVANRPPFVWPATYATATDTPVEGEIDAQDPDGTVFRHDAVGYPSHGTLELHGARWRRFRYTPNPGFVGTDSCQVIARDDENLPGPPAWLRFRVGPLVDAPAPPASRRARFEPPAPNPARGAAEFAFELAVAGEVTLELRDLGGRRMRGLGTGERAAGRHRIPWNGLDDSGEPVRPGVYFAVLDAGGERLTRRLVVTR
jgi:murein DD-endopeptidase MepM/ murein hydrolase activator NlpD